MASKLKVVELRAELAKRGLDTTGTKPSLVLRLESALEEESTQSAETVADGQGNRKRERDSQGEGDANGPEKVRAVEKFRDMTVKQLREEAKLLGVPATGTKKELLERLCNGPPDNDNSVDTIEVKEEEEKIVTATKKGAAVLDQYLPDHIKSQYHGNDVYDAILNQTNVANNNNKFYVIQLLESDDGGRFMVYNRWGRVGVKGQDKIFGPYTCQHDAISEFEEKFYAKTKNFWSERKEFTCYPKCYTWLEMDYSEREIEPAVQQKSEIARSIQPQETKLESRVAKFISLICNVSMMKQQMMEIGYNANKLPLGKLSKSTILKGYDVLKRIADVIGTADRSKLEQLSGEFYTVIPHDFGFKKMREFVINTPQKLKGKLEMVIAFPSVMEICFIDFNIWLVEALAEIEVATKLLEDEPGMQDDPLYCHYNRLGCGLTPVEVDSEEFFMIATYLQNTHAKTHSRYTVDIAQIFRVTRAGENERFRKFSSTKNRMLLWHGSRLTNWTGILSQGLRIAPPEAPVTGYMFGKGVYFADMFSKSANYCYTTRAAPAGVLLLCEVALGDMAELLCAKYDADNLPAGKLSTKGVGGTAPDLSDAKALEDGVIVPLGKPKEQPGHKGSLLYNEYIVYNVDQIRMRYVIQVNFNHKY
ncbi:Poly [ADP-ribose] polymerase 2 [Turnera subulata]|uniref:Poly [ADP-ribose] polymerase n=1 Tax=Turnera subulata TaxID=218843 RepID=A0A9Q0JQP7_9ROSI|nr:Poly [ADP-ribose] polymerase 2 [Turnera subulata]